MARLVFSYNFASSQDSSISRLTFISESSGTLECYKYLGLDTIVEMDHPETGLNLTYISQTGSTGDAGDKYVGLDRFGRVVDQNWYDTATSSSTDDFQYRYDRDSNVLYMKNTVSTGNSELYGYNGLSELTSFERGTLNGSDNGISGTPSINETWTLDALGNWLSVTVNGSTQTRTANSDNQISSISSLTTPGYDGNGNTTTDQNGNTFVYDAWNRLVEVKSGSTVLETDSYDALGRKIVVNTGTARDVYFSQYWQDIEEDVSGTPLDQYVWGAAYVDELVERDRDADGNPANGLEERLFAQQNANWDITALVNTSGTVEERYLYDPYGTATVLTGSWGSRGSSSYAWVFLHQGGQFDAASGLYDFRNREYSPALGRWIQEDPIGFKGGDWNLYRYLENNTRTTTDPSGLGPYFPRPKPKPKTPRPTIPLAGGSALILTPIRIEYREIDTTGLDKVTACAAKLVPHAYISFGPGGRWGLYNTQLKQGDLAESELNKPLLPPFAYVPLYKVPGEIVHGGKGNGKKVEDATDEEIWDSIINYPLRKDYGEFSYNCYTWADEAAANAGLKPYWDQFPIPR